MKCVPFCEDIPMFGSERNVAVTVSFPTVAGVEGAPVLQPRNEGAGQDGLSCWQHRGYTRQHVSR